MGMITAYDNKRKEFLQLLDEVKRDGNYIRVAANTLASIYHEEVEAEVINNIDKHTQFLDTISRKYKEGMNYSVRQLDLYSGSIGLSEDLPNETIKRLIDNLTTDSEEKLVSIVKSANDTYELIKSYGGLDLDESSGFYEETIEALIDIQQKSLQVDELFMELCNPVYDKLLEIEDKVVEEKQKEEELIFPEAANQEPQPEVKDKYWALESFGDVIDYDNQEVVSKVIPLAVFKEKPTYEELTDYFFFGGSGWSTDKADIELLLETGESRGEFGREVHLPHAEYKLIECEYD